MNDRDGLFLQHVLNTIDEIESFTAEGQRGFMSDRETQNVVQALARSSDSAPARNGSAARGSPPYASPTATAQDQRYSRNASTAIAMSRQIFRNSTGLMSRPA